MVRRSPDSGEAPQAELERDRLVPVPAIRRRRSWRRRSVFGRGSPDCSAGHDWPVHNLYGRDPAAWLGPHDPILMPPGACHPPNPPIEWEACSCAGTSSRRSHWRRTAMLARTPPTWENLLDALGAASNLYEYPRQIRKCRLSSRRTWTNSAGISPFCAPRTPVCLTYGTLPHRCSVPSGHRLDRKRSTPCFPSPWIQPARRRWLPQRLCDGALAWRDRSLSY